MIEFYTSEELIEELMKRDTFVGLVIMANDFRTVDDENTGFHLYAKGLLEKEAQGVLTEIVEQMESEP